MRLRTYAYINGRPAQVSPMVVAMIVSCVFLLVGGLFAVIGLVFTNQNKKLEEQCTTSVQAVVVSFKYNDEGLASPVYEYEHNGITHSYSSNSYSNNPVHGVGERAELMINPDNPRQVYVPDDETDGMIGRMFTIMGFSMIGVAVLVVIIFWAAVRSSGKQEQKKEEPWEM